MLDADASGRLAGTRFRDVRWVPDIDSTNRQLLDEARAGAAEGVVLVADHQTAGRGRLGRRWEAPPAASLLVSVLLRPDLRPDELHLCTIAVGVAALEACQQVSGYRPSLKWPNDLIAERVDGTARKLGGILAESVVEADRVSALVVGMGLNVSWPAELPAELVDVATALNHVVDGEVDRGELLVAWLLALEERYGQLATAEGRGRLRDRYHEVCATLGHRVRVEVATGSLVGVAREVSAEGHLIVAADDGESYWVAVGDVVHLRPADED